MLRSGKINNGVKSVVSTKWHNTACVDRPKQGNALHAGGDTPMQILDSKNQRVYFVFDGGLLVELTCRADLEDIPPLFSLPQGLLLPTLGYQLEDKYFVS